MVVVELVIAFVLLAGAGLLGRSLYRLLHVPLGFDPRPSRDRQRNGPQHGVSSRRPNRGALPRNCAPCFKPAGSEGGRYDQRAAGSM